MGHENHSAPVIWEGQPSWSHYILLWIFSAIFGARALISLWMGYGWSALFHFGVIGFLAGIISFLRKTTRYQVTRQSVNRTKGISGKAMQSFPLSAIRSVSIQRGPLERMLGCGNVLLHLKSGITERLPGIKDPVVVSNKIRALL